MLIQDRRPYVRFEYRPRLNPQKSNEEGRQIYDNIAYAIIMQHGSRDEYVKEADDWLIQKKREAAGGHYNPDWVDAYTKEYKAWKEGVELPVEGTPLELCSIINPGEAAQLKASGIKVLEDLATVPDSGLGLLGLNGRILRDKALNWLNSANDKGKVVAQLAKMQSDIESRDKLIEDLTQTLKDLNHQIKQLKKNKEPEAA